MHRPPIRSRRALAFFAALATAGLGSSHLLPAQQHRILRLRGAANESVGAAVAAVGDVDGDGIPDMALGCPQDRKPGFALIHSGKDGRVLFRVGGTSSIDQHYGSAVAGVGDVSGDGVPDFAVGDPGGAGLGLVRVYSGKDASVLYRFAGATIEGLGGALDGAGDVDGDGVPDIVAGAAQNGRLGPFTGAAYVYSGATGSLLHTFYGARGGASYGDSVAGVGDLDLDGHVDVAIGSFSDGIEVRSGRNGSVLFLLKGRGPVDGGYDVDGDGHPDLIVSEIQKPKVYSGKDGSVLRSFTTPPGAVLFGTSVAFVPDVDGDGVADHAVSGYTTVNNNTRGIVWWYSGASGQLLEEATGETSIWGSVLAGVPDIDGDGRGELLVGTTLFGTPFGAEVLSSVPRSLWSNLGQLPGIPGHADRLQIDVGATHAGQNYWIFGSVTGTSPGTMFPNVTIPLVADAYTSLLISFTNTSTFTSFRGRLDAAGRAQATFTVPVALPVGTNLNLFHAALIYDASGVMRTATNAASLLLVR